MNIKFPKTKEKRKIRKLNESQQIVQLQQKNQDSNIEKIQSSLDLSTNQFKFSNGITMCNVNSGVNNPFGLYYWIKKSSSISNFIELVQKAVDFELTDIDIKNLQTEYNKIV